MSAAVLLAELEPNVRGFLEHHLAEDGFEVVGAHAGDEALELAERARPDLVLVGTGLELCRRLREGEPGRSWNRNVPLIVLGQPDAGAGERVRAFDGGCDDYLPGPFEYDELLCRIRAVLRRASPWTRDRLTVRELVVDRATRRVSVSGRAVALSAKEYELLAKLATEPERAFTKAELLRDVWGYHSSSRTRTLDAHASRVRRKLAQAGGGGFVLNVWGVGYRLLSD